MAPSTERGSSLRSLVATARCVAFSLAVASCSATPTPGAGARGHVVTPVAEVTAKLEVHRLEGKPTLTTIAREGDLSPALGAVWLLDDAAMGAAPGLAAVLEDRLRDHGAVARVAHGAVVLTWESSSSASAALRDLTTALRGPIAASPTLARRAAELAGPAVARGLEPAARCRGALALGDATVADVAKPEGATAIEAVRRAVATAERTSIAIVGTRALTSEAIRALAAAPGWPAGTPARRAATGESGVAVIDGEGPAATWRREGDGDVVVSVTMSAATGASSLARRLADPGDPVAARLALLAPRFTVAEASGVARAGGAGSCFRADLRARRPEALDAEAVGRAAHVVRAAAEDRSRDVPATASRAILTAGDARDAAARAAWWATTSDAKLGAVATFVAVAQPRGTAPRISAEDASRAVAATPAPRAVERRTRHEPGQGAFVMAVGSPCPATVDTRTLGGAASLALGLVAAAGSRPDDVEIVPFLRAEGAGLVARGEPRAGEDARSLAARVARALGVAMVGRPPAIADVERARARLVEHAASTWGHPETSEALVLALVPENPLALAPFGHEGALVRAEAAVASATTSDVLSGPLRVAILSNVDATQADAATSTLAALLPPGPPKACSSRAGPTEPQRGRLDVRVAGDERFAQLTLALGPLAPETAEVALAIVGHEAGHLARAAAGLGASLRPRRVGAHVVVDLRVAPERTDDLVRATQGALDGVARDPIDEATSRALLAVARTRLRALTAEPVDRAVELWTTGSVVERGAPDPRSIAPRLGWAGWIAVVARPQ